MTVSLQPPHAHSLALLSCTLLFLHPSICFLKELSKTESSDGGSFRWTSNPCRPLLLLLPRGQVLQFLWLFMSYNIKRLNRWHPVFLSEKKNGSKYKSEVNILPGNQDVIYHRASFKLIKISLQQNSCSNSGDTPPVPTHWFVSTVHKQTWTPCIHVLFESTIYLIKIVLPYSLPIELHPMWFKVTN